MNFIRSKCYFFILEPSNEKNEDIQYEYRDAKQNLCIDSKGNHFSCMYTTEMGNTAMEWKFYGLFGDIFKNCEKLSY